MSKALELAEKLTGLCVAEFAWSYLNDAAHTLRRQHAEIERLQESLDTCGGTVIVLKDQVRTLQAQVEALRKDAELWRFFLSTRPPETHAVIVESMTAAMGEKA